MVGEDGFTGLWSARAVKLSICLIKFVVLGIKWPMTGCELKISRVESSPCANYPDHLSEIT